MTEKNEDENPSIGVTTGDITGAGIIVGSDINLGSITIGDTKIEIDKSIEKNPNSEYLEALKNLTENQLLLLGKLQMLQMYYVNKSDGTWRILIDNPWGTNLQMSV